MRHVDIAGVSGPRSGSCHHRGLGRDPRSERSPPVLQYRRRQPFVAFAATALVFASAFLANSIQHAPSNVTGRLSDAARSGIAHHRRRLRVAPLGPFNEIR
jgi:hypothetical protein